MADVLTAVVPRARHSGRRQAPGRRPHRADIEGLRAVAVLLVVAFHAGWGLFGGGFVGVDVFFVLSGFLITGLLADELVATGELGFARFYGRRVRRLLPLATLVLVVTAVAFAGVVSPLDRGALVADIRAAALYGANWHFAAGSLDYMSDPNKSPVLHFWSLSVEEQFYFVWPLLLVLVARSAARRRRPTLARRRMFSTLAALALASFAASALLTSRSGPYAYYGLHTRAWELAAGGLLALAAGRSGKNARPSSLRRLATAGAAPVGWLGLAAVVASAVLMGESTSFPGTAAALPVVGTVLVVAAGGLAQGVGPSRLLAHPVLTYVGRISYGWYLWHWPCLIYAHVKAGASITTNDVAADVRTPVSWTVLAVVVSLLLAVVSHHLLEDPVRRSAWLSALRFRSLSMGAALMVTAVGGTMLALPAGGGHGQLAVATVAAAPPPPLAGPSSAAPTASPSPQRRVVRLTMSPAQARADRPTADRDCYVGFRTTSPPEDCVFGDPSGTTTVALVGDSHAEAWFPAMQRIATKRHWRLLLYTKSECPFVGARVQVRQIKGPYVDCDSWDANLADHLRALGPVDAVVIAHTSGYTSALLRPDGSWVRARDAGPVWRAGFAKTLHALDGVARKVVVLRDVPRPNGDLPACLAEHTRDISSCQARRKDAFFNTLYDAERAAADDKTVFVDLDDVLCPGDPCPVVWSDGTVMYRDSHHITASLSARLAPLLGPRLAAAITAPQPSPTATTTG